MECTEQIREDLLRYMQEYGWEPRITTKLLNLRHGTNYTAEDVKALYCKYSQQEVDPVVHFLNEERRRSPILPD